MSAIETVAKAKALDEMNRKAFEDKLTQAYTEAGNARAEASHMQDLIRKVQPTPFDVRNIQEADSLARSMGQPVSTSEFSQAARAFPEYGPQASPSFLEQLGNKLRGMGLQASYDAGKIVDRIVEGPNKSAMLRDEQ